MRNADQLGLDVLHTLMFAPPRAADCAGTYAEYATIKSDLLAVIPDDVSFDQAASLPLVSLTAMQESCTT